MEETEYSNNNNKQTNFLFMKLNQSRWAILVLGLFFSFATLMLLTPPTILIALGFESRVKVYDSLIYILPCLSVIFFFIPNVKQSFVFSYKMRCVILFVVCILISFFASITVSTAPIDYIQLRDNYFDTVDVEMLDKIEEFEAKVFVVGASYEGVRAYFRRYPDSNREKVKALFIKHGIPANE